MDRETFTEILQVALFNFDGVEKNELIKKYELNPELVKIGIKLCEYLKFKEINGDFQ